LIGNEVIGNEVIGTEEIGNEVIGTEVIGNEAVSNEVTGNEIIGKLPTADWTGGALGAETQSCSGSAADVSSPHKSPGLQV
jgi:hypothetical protein